MYHDTTIIAMWFAGACACVAFVLLIGIIVFDVVDERRRERRRQAGRK